MKTIHGIMQARKSLLILNNMQKKISYCKHHCKKKIDEGVNTLLEIKELMKKDVAKKPQTTWICPKCKTVNDGYAPKCKCGFEKNW